MNKIKNVFIILAILLIPFTAISDEYETCKILSSVAEQIMEVHQAGVSMADAMETALHADFPPRLTAIIKEMVINAYKQPRYSTKEYQRKIIAEFRDKYYLMCIDANK